MSCINNLLVVGGGIAGLTAAAALAQRGIKCDLIEANSGEEAGAGIVLFGRALEGLESIGGLSQCFAEGLPDPATSGNRDPNARDIFLGAKSVGIYRPILARILRDRATALGASLQFNIGLVDLRQDEDGVDVRLTDGTSRRYDLVIGADGIRSKTRSLCFGDDIQPQYAGQSNIRWMTPGDPIPSIGGIYFAPWGKLLAYSLPVQKLTYAVTVFASDTPVRLDQDKARDLVRQQLGYFPDPQFRELANRLTSDVTLISRPFEWLRMPGPWHKGRVVLAGDAAHATTAHMSSGGGMAIEDGVVLAEELARANKLSDAMDGYMKRRESRVRLVLDTSLEMARMEMQGATEEQLFKFAMPAFTALAAPY